MQESQLICGLSQEQIAKSYGSLKVFNRTIYPLSFPNNAPYIPGTHLDTWADMLQEGNACIVSARKHSKSVTIYGYLEWETTRHLTQDFEIMYMSYKKQMAAAHISKFKDAIRTNPFFSQLKDLTSSTTEGIAKYTWDGIHKFTVKPAGILTFSRGAHPHVLVMDDVLADPTSQLDLGIIDKINRLVKEVAMSLPKEGGEMKIVGTAQTNVDFFWDLKHAPHFKWGMFKAITDWKLKKTLWPQMFSWDRLMQIREYEVGHKGFEKEYQVAPVWSADSFFTREDLSPCINPNLRTMRALDTKNQVVGGWDIGKHAHPAHITVFEFKPIGNDMDIAIQRFQLFMDGWDYKKQLDYVKAISSKLRVDYWNFDATRGELEGFYEQGQMDPSKFIPINFNTKMKNQLAADFEKRVLYEDKNGNRTPLIHLLNHDRMINQILCVTNDLDAVQTKEGHGDSFWSIALALKESRTGNMEFLTDPDNVLGMS